jgi:hypothetical protein
MMNLYLNEVNAMADETTSPSPGLSNPHVDFIFNVGTRDLIDGLERISNEHRSTITGRFGSERPLPAAGRWR